MTRDEFMQPIDEISRNSARRFVAEASPQSLADWRPCIADLGVCVYCDEVRVHLARRLMAEYGTPRRAHVELQAPAERAIRAAIVEVAKLGASPELTAIENLLGQALAKTGDEIDRLESQRSPT